MENNPRQSKSKEMYNAENMRDKEIMRNEDGTKRTKRQRRAGQLFTRFMKRRQSAKISKEMRGAQQTGQRTKEQLVAASTDSGLMRKLLKRTKINRRKIEKAEKKNGVIDILDKFDGTRS